MTDLINKRTFFNYLYIVFNSFLKLSITVALKHSITWTNTSTTYDQYSFVKAIIEDNLVVLVHYITIRTLITWIQIYSSLVGFCLWGFNYYV